MNRWIIGITGASGIRYALRLLDVLETQPDIEIHLVLSEAALRVLHDEENLKIAGGPLGVTDLIGRQSDHVIVHNSRDIGASIASGSFVTHGMVIIPCSMSTLGAIAHGVHAHLIHRAADVVMKEGRKLIIVPRETPLSAIHIENMLTLSRLGVAIIPAMPGFYNKPRTIEGLIDMMVMKVLDSMGIKNSLATRWQG